MARKKPAANPPPPGSRIDYTGRSIEPEDNLQLACWLSCGYVKDKIKRGALLQETEEYADAVVGLVIASKKFKPEMGYRYATYAQWWMRREIQEGQILRGTRIHERRKIRNREMLFTDIENFNALDPDSAGAHAMQLAVEPNEADPQSESPMQRVWPLLEKLEIRERRFLFKRMMGMSLDEVGADERPPLSKERVRQILDRGITNLREAVRRLGITREGF